MRRFKFIKDTFNQIESLDNERKNIVNESELSQQRFKKKFAAKKSRVNSFINTPVRDSDTK